MDQVNLTISPSQTKKKKDTFLSAYAHSVLSVEIDFFNESFDWLID